MNLIQIGLGDFGLSWLKDVLLTHGDVKVLAVVDKNEAVLNKAKALPGMENALIFTGIEEALEVIKPDFIFNATPPKIHREINLVAFQHKLPILSEKPIAESYSEALEILERSLEAKVPLMIAENYRYSSIVRTAYKLLSQGEIGNIGSIQIDFCRRHRMENYHRYLEHPLLLDVTIHHLDMLRYLTGTESKAVFARSWTQKWSWYEKYSTLDLLIDMEKDIKVSYRGSLSSFNSETDWFGSWRIEGEKGVLKISKGTISVLKEGNEDTIEVTEPYDSRRLVLEEFLNSLNSGKPGETDIRDNIKTQAMVEAAVRSINNSQVVKL
jgi:predicted dehydrogenase